MKQFLMEIYSISDLMKQIQPAREYALEHKGGDVLVHIYYGARDISAVSEIIQLLRNEIPSAKVLGTSSSGEIIQGHITAQSIVVSVLVFEKTKVQVGSISCRDMTEQEAGIQIRKSIEQIPEAAAVELLVTLKQGLRVQQLLHELDSVDNRIVFFGAGADTHAGDDRTYVFTAGGPVEYGVAWAIYSGQDFHAEVDYSLGWKPLGRYMKVTRAEGNVLYELDGRPAFEIYNKYLRIENDDSFSDNVLEFPILFTSEDQYVARVPISCNPDGSLVLGADIEEGSMVRLGYGDPAAITEAVIEKQRRMRHFSPQIILLYSCITRKIFWKYYVNNELGIFEKLAPSVGFYTYGEIIRVNGRLYDHNASMITIGMREGEARADTGLAEELQEETGKAPGQMSILQRLVYFIQETTKDLEEARMKHE